MSVSTLSYSAGRTDRLNLWDWLTAPSKHLQGSQERRNARLMATMLVILIPLIAAALVASGLTALVNLSPAEALRLSATRWGLFAFIVVAYVITRTRRYLIGAGLMMLMFWAIVFLSAVQNPNAPIGYGAGVLLQILPILIASMVFPYRGVLAVMMLVIGSQFLLPLLQPILTLPELVLPIIILLLLAAIVVVAMRHRTLIERDRRAELETALKRAEEANRLKNDFLATMSHELRTPLHAIIGYTDIQLEGMAGELSDEQREYQSRILLNADHLLGLINDILDLAKIEAGRLEIVRKPFAVRGWLDEVVSQTRGLADQKGLELEVRLDDMPAEIVADAERLKQITINLLSNAVKFTSAGKVSLNVARHGNSVWKLSVADTGIGIPEHALEVIFDEFRQVDSSSRREYGGTGLGLAIVRKLALSMGGTIRVESEVGKGSTFTLLMPLDVRDSAPNVAAPALMSAEGGA